MNAKSLKILEFDFIKGMLKKNAQSVVGKELVDKMEPSTSPNKIAECQVETTQAVACLSKRGSPPIGDIPDIRNIIKKVELDAILNNSELLAVMSNLKCARQLKGYSSETKDIYKLSIIDSLIESLASKKLVEDEIYNAIISEDEISDNASVTLRSIRREINDTNNRIKDKLNQIIHSTRNQKFLQDSIVTIRDGRYVVPVKQEYRGEIAGLVHDSSASGATLFIEPMAVVEANNRLKELFAKEKIEIEVILAKLTELVKENLNILKSNILIISKLDFIFAKGRFSIELEAIEPKINTNGYINLIKARHPLIDKSKVVPIDINVGNDFNTLVITGPNTGGKTVSLKTVGLLQLMAQCGLHIPAKDNSEVSVFENIFADIGDEQSIEQSLSTFSSHMTNIVEIIKNANNKSLCLFDELGAGTDPAEGAALAMSILEHLNQKGAKTIATTHYSQLKAFAVSNKGYMNASCEFDIETLKPTYRVIMGIPGKSNAFLISKRLGLTDHVIEAAKKYISTEGIKFEDIINSLHQEKVVLEAERQKAQNYKNEVEELKKQAELQKEEIEKTKEKLLYEAKQKALKLLEEAQDEIDEIIEEMKIASKIREDKERERAVNQAKDKLKSRINKEESEITGIVIGRKSNDTAVKDIKLGQTVLVTNIDKQGMVLTLPDSNGNLTIQVGIMKINSNIKFLKIVEEKSNSKKERVNTSNMRSPNIQTEIDLRGQLLDDALMLVDKYLDDSAMSGLNQVTIIHGKGTGALRTGIHKFLKHHPHVRTFRLGVFGEGEAGVTIVELK